MEKQNLQISLVYIFICLLWGSTWLAIRLGLDSLTPLISAGLRFTTASLLVLIVMKIRKSALQTDKTAIILYILMGLFSFSIPFGLVYWAQQFVPSGLASVLFAVYPFFVAIFSYLAMPETKIGFVKLTGIFLGFGGIIIIFSDNITLDIDFALWGMLAIVVSGMMQAFVAVAIKKYGQHLNPLAMNFIPLAIGGSLLLFTGLIFENVNSLVFDLKAVGSVLYLALFGTVFTFTSYYWLLKRINIVILSLVAFITPVIALFLGWIILNEELTTTQFIGSSVVLVGVLFANISFNNKFGRGKG